MRAKGLSLCALSVLLTGMGCAKTVSEPPIDDPVKNETQVTEADQLGRFHTGVDSAAALFDFGDVEDFLAARDSIHASITEFANAYPSVSNDPRYQQILKVLSDLDSLSIMKTYGRSYTEEIDSLALAAEEWPEIGPTEPIKNDRSVAGDETVFPKITNERIEFWVRYFTGPGKERFARSLYRMQLYRPLVEEILAELGLPNDLICVAMIESGFHLKARSYAKAVGPWQFIPGTARIYGLRVNWWFDERRDIVASTYAAGNYLKDLYGIWNSWPLALAGYNCGEYRVARAIARQKTEDFWELDLPKQTERYYPKFLAALYIVREPEKYGFVIPDIEPVAFDEVTIKDATDIKLIAEAASTTVDFVKEINPGILRWCTPPKTELNVKVPAGSGVQCEEKIAAIPASERVTWRRHRIKQGESLSQIARKYNTTTTTLKRLNGIKNAHRIRAGHSLIVPIQGAYAEVASTKPQYKDKHRTISKQALESYAKKYAPPTNHQKVIYTVKDKDTLGEIAELYKTRASKIRAWNNLRYRSYIYPGQKLTIYVPPSFDLARVPASSGGTMNSADFVKNSYTVKKGDSFYSISKKFNVRMSDLIAWNGKSSKSKIYPGEVLEVWQRK